MKKIISTILSVVLVGVIAVGCSSGNGQVKESASTSTQKDAGQKVSITLWTLDNHLYIDPVVEDFKKENPNIDVQVSKYGVDPIKEALKVAANSKTLPDLWFTWGGSLGGFYPENELTMDLTQVSKDHKWSEIYNKAALDMSTYDGKVSGVPLHLNVLNMWYPKSVYDKLKLSPPATFADFEAQMKTMKENGITPLTMAGKNGWHIMRLTEQLIEHFAGPEQHDKLNNLTASWNDPAVVKSFEKLKEYTDKGYFPKGFVSLSPDEADAVMYQEKAGFVVQGTWFDRTIRKAGFEPNHFNAFKFPNEQKPSRVSVFAEMYQLNGKTDKAKQDASLKLAEYITSLNVVNKHIDKYSTPAALNVKISDTTPHINQILDSATDGGFLITDQALPQIVAQKLFEAQDKVALGEWTPQQAAEAIDKAASDYKSTKAK